MDGATTIQNLIFTRDDAGRITAVNGNRTDEDFTYGYDSLDRLLSATNSAVPALSQTYTYDLAGNMLTNSQVGTYTYPTQGALAVKPHAVTSAGSWSFNYDDNGNQTDRLVSSVSNRAIAYDGENRPISVTLSHRQRCLPLQPRRLPPQEDRRLRRDALYRRRHRARPGRVATPCTSTPM